MAMTRLGRLVSPKTECSVSTVVILSLLWVSYGCAKEAKEEGKDIYRESNGRVKEFNLALNDPYMRIVAFVKLKDGTIQNPYIYYYQGHFTSSGFAQVEKPGRLYTTVVPSKPYLHLPVSDDIDEYLLLISKPLPDNGPPVKDKPIEWSDWGLLSTPAAEITTGESRTISIPPHSEVVKASAAKESLLLKLKSLYAKSEAAAKKRADTPIRSDTKVPDYAR